MNYSNGARALGLTCISWLVACSEGPAVSGSAGTAPGGAGQGSVLAGSGGGGSSAAGASSAGDAAGGMAAGGVSGSAGSGGASGETAGGQAGMAPIDPNAPEPSMGCGSAEPLAEGEIELQVGDLMRSYVVRKPENYDAARPWPLLLALHPNGSGSSYWDATSGERAFRPLLAEEAILVLPQGRENDWRGDVPLDLEYFDALLAQVQAGLCVDKKRIFAMGFSGGGSFSGALGCYRTDIRAIAAGGAVIYFEEPDCVGSPAAWITIGDLESIQGRLDYRDFFRTDAGCENTSQGVPPEMCIAYDCPDPKRPVHFCSHPGDHVWPSFGTSATWDFFTQF